jgi:hypothetical protein
MKTVEENTAGRAAMRSSRSLSRATNIVCR